MGHGPVARRTGALPSPRFEAVDGVVDGLFDLADAKRRSLHLRHHPGVDEKIRPQEAGEGSLHQPITIWLRQRRAALPCSALAVRVIFVALHATVTRSIVVSIPRRALDRDPTRAGQVMKSRPRC